MESATQNPYLDDVVISWPELHRDTRFLCHMLLDKGPFRGIIAITRGGLVPAALVARELDIRLIDTICVSSYEAGGTDAAATRRGEIQVLKGLDHDGSDFLLIDDLVDTGNTARVIRKLLPRAHFATLYAKPMGRPVVDTCVKEFKQEKWIHFPWDIDYRFTPPLRSKSG